MGAMKKVTLNLIVLNLGAEEEKTHDQEVLNKEEDQEVEKKDLEEVKDLKKEEIQDQGLLLLEVIIAERETIEMVEIKEEIFINLQVEV